MNKTQPPKCTKGSRALNLRWPIRGARELVGAKVASSGLSFSKQEEVILMPQTIFSLLLATSSWVDQTGFKLSPMTLAHIPSDLALPGLFVEIDTDF